MCALHTESISARLNQRCSSVTSPTVHIFHAACGVSPLQMENLSSSSSCSPSSPSTELCSNYSLLVVKTLCFQCRGMQVQSLVKEERSHMPMCRVTWPKNGQNKFFCLSRSLPPPPTVFPKKVLFLKHLYQHHCFHVFLQHLSISSQKTMSTLCSSWNLPDLVKSGTQTKCLLTDSHDQILRRFKNKPEQMFWKVHNLTLK